MGWRWVELGRGGWNDGGGGTLGGGEGVSAMGILGQSPFDQAQQRAQALVAVSIQVQVQVELTSFFLLGAVLKKA